MIRPLTSANTAYGVLLPPPAQSSDGALFYKTAPDLGGLNPIGLYIFNFQQDFNSVLPGEQVQTGWTQLTDEVGKYLLKTGDTMAGDLTMGANRLILGPLFTDYASIFFESTGDNTRDSALVFETGDNAGLRTEGFIWRMTGPGVLLDVMSLNEDGLKVNGSTVWHSGNDGAGSGLDADTLDGQGGSYYLDLANATGTLPNSMLTNKMFYDFGSNTAVSSPKPDTFPAGSISGFDAYGTSDMGSYQVGLQVIGTAGGGAQSMQLSANWDSEETAPAQLRFRTNDDTSDKTAWSPWSTILLAEGVGLATQLLQSSGSSAPTWVNPSTITAGATLSVNIAQAASILGMTIGMGANPALRNMAFGTTALYNPTITGAFNIAIGDSALISNSSGAQNIAVGLDVLRSNTSGTENIGIGYQALRASTIGNRNTSIGPQALYRNTTGSNNVAIGASANYSNESASDNVVIGENALLFGTSGQNTIIGASANAIGINTISSTAVGFRALYNNAATQNIGLGYLAGSAITTGNYNVVIGSSTGSSIATSSNNIIISDGQGNERITVNGAGVTNITGSLTVNGAAVGGGGGGTLNSLSDVDTTAATSPSQNGYVLTYENSGAMFDVGTWKAKPATGGPYQSWQNVAASRALGVTYTNTTGQNIAVNIKIFGSGGAEINESASLVIGGIVFSTAVVSGYSILFGIIPYLSTYAVVESPGGTATLIEWFELK